jgi:hypothetical protein
MAVFHPCRIEILSFSISVVRIIRSMNILSVAEAKSTDLLSIACFFEEFQRSPLEVAFFA